MPGMPPRNETRLRRQKISCFESQESSVVRVLCTRNVVLCGYRYSGLALPGVVSTVSSLKVEVQLPTLPAS